MDLQLIVYWKYNGIIVFKRFKPVGSLSRSEGLCDLMHTILLEKENLVW